MWILFFTAVVTWLSLAEYSQELKNAYDWAFQHKITTQPTIDQANLYGQITRQAMAKMMVVFSMDILEQKPDYTIRCQFEDEDEITPDLREYVQKACQFGIMGQNTKKFNPMWKVTKAQFWTTLSRALWWRAYEGSDPYYAAHLSALLEYGIIDDISNPTKTNISRWEVIRALLKSAETIGYSVSAYSTTGLNNKNFFDPEIEYLMTENKYSEKEKKIMRDYVYWLEFNNIENFDKLEDLVSKAEVNKKADEATQLSSIINELYNVKQKKIKNYYSDIKNVYTTLKVDLEDTSSYTPWEKIKKIDVVLTKLSDLIDSSIKELSILREVYNKWYVNDKWDFTFPTEDVKKEYEKKMADAKEEYNKIEKEYDETIKEYKVYLEEYKINNKYWAAYYGDTYTGSDMKYLPKDATYVSWYLVWSDWTIYKWDTKNWKLEGKWVLSKDKDYYSGEWKNNLPNGYGEENNQYYNYLWYFKNGIRNWFWVLKMKNWNYIYTWEFLNDKRHGTWEYSTSDYTFSWTFKNDEFSEWKLVYKNWMIYEWTFKNNDFDWTWKLTLINKEVYQWSFSKWKVNGQWTLTMTNWVKYAWEWKNWKLNDKGVYIEEGKVIVNWEVDIIDNLWNDTIVITDGKDTLTMMNKNIWADKAGTWEDSYGYFFKYWNNKGFSSLSTSDTNEYGKALTGNWSEKEQGPCPSGYHIPTSKEWDWVVDIWKLKNNITSKKYTKEQIFNFSDTFKLPLAGERIGTIIDEDPGDTIFRRNNSRDASWIVLFDWFYWTSSKAWSNNAPLRFWINFDNSLREEWIIQQDEEYQTRGKGYSVRCFKN